MEENLKDESPLQDVAEAITDGKPVDWEARAARGGDASKLEKLKIIEQVATAYNLERSRDLDLAVGATPRAALLATPAITNGSTAAPGAPAAEPAPQLAPNTPTLFHWGGLRVLEKIGRGGFADVYRAWDPSLRREVALKLQRQDSPLDARSRQRFIDEAQKLARVKHDNVLKVHGVDEHDGQVGIWTDLLEGQNLKQCIESRGAYGAQEAGAVGMALCSAVASLHQVRFIHRDITPTNVMRVGEPGALQGSGRIVLMDFGSARDAAPATDSSAVSGTPLVTAPEVLLSGEPPKATQDIYGIGVLLYYLVTGHYPVEARNLDELKAKHARGESVQLLDLRPDLPQPFARVVQKALSRDPAARFDTAGQMQEELAAALGTVRPLPRTPPDVRTRNPHTRLRWTALLAAAASIAVIVAFAAPHWRPAPQVQAALYREDGQNQERLTDGGHVRPQDQLFLDIRFDQPMYVWVVNEDERGDAYALFPLGSEVTTRLSAGASHRLPGTVDGSDSNWSVSTNGGRETILVVASSKQLPDLEKQFASLAHPGFQDPLASTNQKGTERSISRLVPRAPGAEGRGVVARLMRQYGDRQGRGGVWLWKVQLENDGT